MLLLDVVLHLVKELGRLFWTIWVVLELRPLSLAVLVMLLEFITVLILRMLEWFASVCGLLFLVTVVC